MTGRRWMILIALVAGQAWLTSTVFNPGPHNGGDNAGYVALAHALATGQGYVETWDPALPAHTKYPPVFPLLLAILVKFGVTTWTGLKSVAFVGTLATTAATFLWASRRLGLALGTGIAVLTGFSWSILWHGGFVLSDVPFLAFTLLALWAVDESMSRRGEDGAEGAGAGRYLILAGVAAFLAYFTRSAGLPLVAAILGSLLLRRRVRSAAVLGGMVGVPALLWLIRGMTAGSDEGRYASEFLLVNPYDPGLGRAGPADFVARVVGNVQGYLGTHIPKAFTGAAEMPVVIVVSIVLAFAILGWVVSIRRERGPAELFAPMYVALILLWPTVWSGDRFALPLIPLLLVFAAEGIRWVGERLADRVGSGLATMIVPVGSALVGVTLLGPMVTGWRSEVRTVNTCRSVVAEVGPWGCSGSATLAFATMAEWTGEVFPEGTPMLTRKPRIFHVLSGLTSRTYPFDDDPAVLFEEAERIGARHVILDGIGTTGRRYVGGALTRRPERFCQVVSIGRAGTSSQTMLLGFLPDGAPEIEQNEEGRILLSACPDDMQGEDVPFDPTLDGAIPLLVRSRAGR